MNINKKLNVLHISTCDNKGGAAKVAWTLKQELEKRGHTTSMFVKHKFSTAKNVYQIPNSFSRSFLSVVFASDLDFSPSDKILKTEQYRRANIVHCHNLHGNYFNLTTLQKMAQEKPLIWSLHDMWAITPHCAYALDGQLKNGFYQCPSRKIYPSILWPNEKYLEWRKKKVYENASFEVVVPSHWLEEKVKASILGNHQTSLIYYGVDTKVFKKFPKDETKRKLSLPLDKKIIVFVADGGKDNPWKGWKFVQSIVSHYRRNKDVLFLCIGGNQNSQELYDENIKFIPFIFDKSTLAQYYSVSDVFLLTSLADNFPNTVLEAMSCGVPVVSFDVGGVNEAVIHKRNGYIAKYKDVPDIIRGMNYILNFDADSLKRMSKDSISRVKHEFTVDTMIKRYLQLYTSLLRT